MPRRHVVVPDPDALPVRRLHILSPTVVPDDDGHDIDSLDEGVDDALDPRALAGAIREALDDAPISLITATGLLHVSSERRARLHTSIVRDDDSGAAIVTMALSVGKQPAWTATTVGMLGTGALAEEVATLAERFAADLTAAKNVSTVDDTIAPAVEVDVTTEAPPSDDVSAPATDDGGVPAAVPRFHLAIPVDDLDEARRFYGEVLGLTQGRSDERWIDWNLHGHQFVTHLAATPPAQARNPVDGHDVPVPHFGVLLDVEGFHALAQRLRGADTAWVIEPYLRFEGEPGEQWTMFLLDPAGNALEFKAFADDGQVFAV